MAETSPSYIRVSHNDINGKACEYGEPKPPEFLSRLHMGHLSSIIGHGEVFQCNAYHYYASLRWEDRTNAGTGEEKAKEETTQREVLREKFVLMGGILQHEKDRL